MTADESAFLAAIAAAPDDEAPHRVFADWLDEHDRPEEADYHRRWTVKVRRAEEWFARLAASHFHDTSYPYPEGHPSFGFADRDEPEVPYTAAELVAAGRRWVETWTAEYNQGEFTYQYGGRSLQRWMAERGNRAEFWRNWSLATGIPVAAGVPKDGHVFACSC